MKKFVCRSKNKKQKLWLVFYDETEKHLTEECNVYYSALIKAECKKDAIKIAKNKGVMGYRKQWKMDAFRLRIIG